VAIARALVNNPEIFFDQRYSSNPQVQSYCS
jgi:ABC-type methionine transport system ATPase subunit